MGKDDSIKNAELAEATESVEKTGADIAQNEESAETSAPESATQELRGDEQQNISEQPGSEENTIVDTTGETTAPETEGNNSNDSEMSKAEERKEIAEKLFEENPAKQSVYFSSDMIPFFDKHDAHKYGDRLADTNVITINRE